MIVNLHYLRGIAALMVVYHHLSIQTARTFSGFELPWAPIGAIGVDIFFIISGFIMWVTTQPAGQDQADFFFKRVVRVVPLYWAVISVVVLAMIVVPEALFTARMDLAHVVGSYLFVPMWHPAVPDRIWPVLIPGWTLNYEMAFYLLLGSLLWLPRRAQFWATLGTLAALASAGALFAPQSAIMRFYTSPLLLEFAFGLVLGWIYLRGIRLPSSAAIACILVALAALLFQEGEPGATRAFFWGLPAVLIVAALVSLDTGKRASTGNILFLLGSASYALYLTHVITLPLVAKGWTVLGAGGGTPAIASFTALGIAACVGVGIATHLAFEQPVSRLLYRLRARRRVVPTEEQPVSA
jgi:exopolysaccharide production protein ExoZ